MNHWYIGLLWTGQSLMLPTINGAGKSSNIALDHDSLGYQYSDNALVK